MGYLSDDVKGERGWGRSACGGHSTFSLGELGGFRVYKTQEVRGSIHLYSIIGVQFCEMGRKRFDCILEWWRTVRSC